ncbi:hypothetical protein Zmor_000448 [Zophobas morio]|uniref:Odorant receptor n=1 Tax=Zophobas morio TaxID=2755281 RepID=A0AA38MRH5_9CUCU|nr:hypothetical protein Zmor_000448 [Zophobas morio]
MGFTIQDYNLRKTFTIEKKLLLFAGFYPRRTSKNKYAYVLGATVNLFLSIAQFLSMLMQLIVNRNDLSKLSETLQYFITHTTFICKLTNFVVYKKNLLNIEDTLEMPIFYGFSHDHLKLLKQKVAACENVGTVFRVLCVAAVAFWALPPYLDPAKSKSLPIPGWFPYNVTDYYYPTFAFQMIGIANTAYTNSTIDILTWMLISVASGQFEILKENLKDIDYGSPDLTKTNESFKNCVKHHREIVRFVYKIENTFSKGIFLQFFASVIVICFTGFLMIIVPVVSMQFALLLTYFLCMMCQVAMYCWYGHDVMTTSNTIGQSFHMSNWYDSDLTIRRDVIIFLERTIKPVTLTAGGYVTLSLTTLTGILRSSYSYFAVLRRLYSDL